MASNIDPTFPVPLIPTTASVRENFAIAQQEISDLQQLIESIQEGGGTGPGGPVAFVNIVGDPTDNAALAGALNARAPLASPNFSGIPTAPTVAQTVNSTQLATTAYVRTAISNVTTDGTGSVAWGAITGVLSNQSDLNTALNARALATNVPTIAAFNALVQRVEALEAAGPGPGPGPGTPWQVTFTYPDHMVFSRFVPPPSGGTIPLNQWTGWNPAYAADMTDDALYGPHLTNQNQLPVQMYATFVGQDEVRVDFDNWGGTAGENKITDWGFLSGEMAVTVRGSNGTGNPIQLRLVKA